MKKTLSVNLGGNVYHIDEDAFQELTDYLQGIKRHLGSDESAAEVLTDIEQRISELFEQWMQGKRSVITLDDVRRVYDVLGRPEQFDNGENTTSEESNDAPEEEKQESYRTQPHRKLYRDTENSILGGVCAGFATYLNVSVVFVRILYFLMVWFGGTGILFYLICWLVIPEARTAAQKLEMEGEDVTIENIQRKIKDEAGRVKDRVGGYVRSNQFHDNVRTAGNGFVEILRTIIKVLFAFIAGSIGLSAFMVLTGLLFALIVLWTGNIHFISSWPLEIQPLQHLLMNPSSATWLTLGLIVVIGIPFAFIFRLLFGGMLHMKPVSPWLVWVNIILWILGIALCIISGLHLISYTGGVWL